MKNSNYSIYISLIYLTAVFVSCSEDNPNTVNSNPITTQSITINADDYRHEFIGGGVSIGLFLGHHYSMDATAQDQAIQLLAKDCNMKYYQDYIEIYPSDDPAYFDRRANYVKASKVYQPELEFSLVGNKFPANLMVDQVVGGETLKVLDTDDPLIYDKLADWWFQLFKVFHDRGVTTEILNVVNEPDLDKTFRQYHYGLNGNTREAVAQVFKQAVPKFLAMLNDPAINTSGMPVPLIMGPSTLSPAGCIDYMRFFKSNHPEAWDLIDIVATHQYGLGFREDLFELIISEAEGKPLYQSETHALKGDGLNFTSGSISRDLEAALSLARLFTTAVNNGTQSWFYFENNYPNVEVHRGGLLSIPWQAAEPIPYKHYYAFKQLTSAQPASSKVVTYTTTEGDDIDVIAFRKQGQNKVYVHLANYDFKEKELTLSLGGNMKITGYKVTTTDASNNETIEAPQTFNTEQDDIEVVFGHYSLTTLEIDIAN